MSEYFLKPIYYFIVWRKIFEVFFSKWSYSNLIRLRICTKDNIIPNFKTIGFLPNIIKFVCFSESRKQ